MRRHRHSPHSWTSATTGAHTRPNGLHCEDDSSRMTQPSCNCLLLVPGLRVPLVRCLCTCMTGHYRRTVDCDPLCWQSTSRCPATLLMIYCSTQQQQSGNLAAMSPVVCHLLTRGQACLWVLWARAVGYTSTPLAPTSGWSCCRAQSSGLCSQGDWCFDDEPK